MKDVRLYNRLRQALKVNLFMVLPKFSYAFYFSSFFVINSFNTTFLTDVGLSPEEAGVVHGLRSITLVAGGIFWTMLADKTGRHKAIVFIVTFADLGTALPMPWIARQITGHTNEASKRNGSTLQIYENSSSNILSQQFQFLPKHERMILYKTMIALNLLGGFFSGPMIGFLDSAATQRVKKSVVPTSIGQQLRFASLGAGVGPALVGVIAKYVSFGDLSQYTAMFLVYVVGTCSTCLFVYIMFSSDENEGLTEQGTYERIPDDTICATLAENEFSANAHCMEETGLVKTLLQTLFERHVLFFFLVVAILTSSYGVQEATLLIFLMSLGASSLVQGLAVFFELGMEFFMYGFVNWIMHRVGGEVTALAVSALLYSIRALLISFLSNPWLVLPILSMTSLFQPLYVTAMLQMTMKICPPKLEATVYAIADSTLTTGSMVGIIVAGAAYQAFGGRALYIGTSVHMVVWVVLVFCYGHLTRHSRRQGSTSINSEKKACSV